MTEPSRYVKATKEEINASKGATGLVNSDIKALIKAIRAGTEDANVIIADAISVVADKAAADARAMARKSQYKATRKLGNESTIESWSGKRSARSKVVRATAGISLKDVSKKDTIFPYAGEFGVSDNLKRKVYRASTRKMYTVEGWKGKHLAPWKGNRFVYLREDNVDGNLATGYAIIPAIVNNKSEYMEMMVEALAKAYKEIV